jgi:predicted NBD/HSP70 family sugar kinase
MRPSGRLASQSRRNTGPEKTALASVEQTFNPASTAMADRVPIDGYAIASSTGVVRAINQRAIYELVRRLGQASAAQLGAQSGLSRPTVALALATLEAAGLLRQTVRRTGGVGRAPRVFEPDPDAGHVLVIDVGRSWLRFAIANIAGEVLVRQDVRARARSAEELLEQIIAMAREVTAGAGVEWAQVTHKVLGTPGVFDPGTGSIRLAPNLPGWQRRGFGHLLVEHLGGGVSICNDVKLATLGEQHFGAGRKVRDFVYLSLGTGVGMGLVLGGELREGAHGAAGEVGFLPVFPGQAEDGGGASGWAAADRRRRGELESMVGAKALSDLARRRGLARASVAEVFDAARKGDAVAISVVDDVARYVAGAVVAVVSMVDPQLVVLGGGIGHNGDLLIPRVRERLGRLVPLDVPEIVSSTLGSDASVLGGISAALNAAQRLLVERAGLAS